MAKQRTGAPGNFILYDDDGTQKVLPDLQANWQAVNTNLSSITTSLSSLVPGSTQWLIAALPAVQFTNITYDSNGAYQTATARWPDGTSGSLTVINTNSTFPNAVDGYTVTYTGTGGTKTVTQPLVTRNANGQITVQPALTVS